MMCAGSSTNCDDYVVPVTVSHKLLSPGDELQPVTTRSLAKRN
jgi:hypothetical protein